MNLHRRGMIPSQGIPVTFVGPPVKLRRNLPRLAECAFLEKTHRSPRRDQLCCLGSHPRRRSLLQCIHALRRRRIELEIEHLRVSSEAARWFAEVADFMRNVKE